MNQGFHSLGLSQRTLDAIDRMGFEEPSPVQVETIPHILDGRDVMAQARTGTGKTAAFGIPLAERATGSKGIETLVLAPTRELANQIRDELGNLGHGAPLRPFAIYGGVGYGKQRHELSPKGRTNCVVACPGRLLDLLERGDADLSNVTTLIFDEADRMLDMGFIHDIRKILEYVPSQRQTLLFSATLPKRVQDLAHRYLIDPVKVEAESGPLATPLTDQYRIHVDGEGLPHLLTLLEREDPERAIVFTKTKHTAKRMAAKLQAAGYKAGALQGNMSQSKRDKTMENLRSGRVRILVATDVAARGLDVDELTHVIQFDLPDQPEDHVHRTGRTGRAGRDGRAFLFVPKHARKKARRIESHAGINFEDYQLGKLTQVPHHVRNAGPKPRRYETVVAGGGGGRSGRGRRR